MSFIETALSKVRRGTAVPRRDSSLHSHRPVVRTPPNRKVADPQLRMTEAMLTRLGLHALTDPDSQRAAEYRHIKQQLMPELRSGDQDHGRILVIASALSGDGKSFTSANLARSLARELDHTVLLVDGDALQPQLTRALELVQRPGLTNALVDNECDVESLVLTTDIEGLSVLPAGSASNDVTEYYGSERMREILQRLQDVPQRIVVIDSLPLLLTTESRALLPLATQVLLVVRAETTPLSAVRKALALVGEGVNLKLVLNAVERTKLSRYVGYEYGYDYDYHEKPSK